MVRVTPPDVQAILETKLGDDALTFWIDVAHEILSDSVEPTGTASESRLELLERLVTAHFAAAQAPTESAMQVGDVRTEFEGLVGEGFKETRYGRRAIALDPSNELIDWGIEPAIFETFGHDADAWG